MKFDILWYGKHPLALALLPLSWLFCAIVWIRRQAYKRGLLNRHSASVPIIIVGNITVGGTGKTPLVLWLAKFLKQQGFEPGIVSRGYGGRANQWPQSVHADSEPGLVGDESVLLARRSGCPVVVAPKRCLAVQSLLTNNDCNLIISDDGLQHYALRRDIEIAVVDEERRYGNRHCLPAGPLREPVSRLKEIDLIVMNGRQSRATHLSKNLTTKDRPKYISQKIFKKLVFLIKILSFRKSQRNSSPSTEPVGNIVVKEFFMSYEPKPMRRVADESFSQPLSAWRGNTVHAVAGIGHSELFFSYLREQGLKLHCHEFGDHYHYCQTDIQFDDDLPVIMTEKDAVKCLPFAGPKHWYLPIEARLSNSFGERLLEYLVKGEN